MSTIEEPPLMLVSLTVGTDQLGTYLRKLSQQLNRQGEMISSLVQEMRSCKMAVDHVKTASNEAVNSVRRTIERQEAQLRVLQQQADTAVSATQMSRVSEQLSSRMQAVEAHLSGAEEQQEHRVREIVDNWWSDTEPSRSKERAGTMASTVCAAVAAVERSLEEGDARRSAALASLNTRVANMASTQDVAAAVAAAREESARDRRNLTSDLATVRGLITESERSFEAGVAGVQESVASQLAAFSDCLHRVDALFSVSGEQGGGRSERSGMAAALCSPLYVELRQQILRDVEARLNTTAMQQRKELDEELSSVRKELRQNVTVKRVLELIGEHADQQTPQRVGKIEGDVRAVAESKVSHDYFCEALRSKADTIILDTKADRCFVSECFDAITAKLAKTERDLADLKAERHQFREVLHDVLYMHKRASAQQAALASQLDASDAPAPSLPNLALSSLTQHGVDPRPPATPAEGSHHRGSARESPVSRQGSRRSVRPLTEARQSRALSDTSPQLTHDAHEAYAGAVVVPLTESQRAYAARVAAAELAEVAATYASASPVLKPVHVPITCEAAHATFPPLPRK